MEKLKIAIAVFRRIEWFCLVAPMTLLIILVFIQIVLRSSSIVGFPWLEEFSRYVFIFCTFLGASIAIDAGAHPKMTALLVAVPKPVKTALLITGDAVCCVLCFIVVYYGYIQITKQIATGIYSTALPIPLFVPYLIIPIGLFTSGVRYAVSLAGNIASAFVKKQPEEIEGRAKI